MMRRKPGTLAVLTFLCAAFGAARSEAGPQPAAPLGSNFDTVLPAAFKALQGQQSANFFSGCLAPQVQNTLQSVASALLKPGGDPLAGTIKGVPLETVCPEGVLGEIPDRCEDLEINGSFNRPMFDTFKKGAEQALAGLTCKKGKFVTIQAELKCLTDGAAQLTQKIGALQQQYVDNIQRYQKDVENLQSIELDRKQQEEQASEHLNGRPGSQDKGLIQARNELQAVLDGFQQDIQNVREAQINTANQRASLAEQITKDTLSRVPDCFRNYSEPGFQCKINGPQVSAIDYFECLFRSGGQVDSRGRIQNDGPTRARAESGAADLRQLLNQILAGLPTKGGVPLVTGNAQQDQAALAGLIDQPLDYPTAADIAREYSSRLAVFDLPGKPISGKILELFGKCYFNSTVKTNNLRNQSNSSIFKASEDLKKFERATTDLVSTVLTKVDRVYTAGNLALFRSNLPLNVDQCRGANVKPSAQLDCLAQLERRMDGLLKGAPLNGSATTPCQTATGQTDTENLCVPTVLVIRGNTPATNETIRCAGLGGCIRDLQNAAKNFATEQQRVREFRRQYVQKANQEIVKFTQSISNPQLQGGFAFNLSKESELLSARKAKINAALALLVPGASIEAEPVEPEQLQPDEAHEGLLLPPTSVLRLVGGSLSPPMLDVNSKSFNLEGISKGMEDLNKQSGEAGSALHRLASLEKSCSTKPIKDAVDSIKREIGSIRGSRCYLRDEYCGRTGSLSQLVGNIKRLSPGSGLDARSIDSLANGIKDACPENADKTKGEVDESNCTAVAREVASKVDAIRGAQGGGGGAASAGSQYQ